MGPVTEPEEITDCPVCGVNGYQHRPACRALPYISSLIDALADELEWASSKSSDAGIAEGHMWAAGRLRERAGDMWRL